MKVRSDRHQIARLVLGEKTSPTAFYESFSLPEKNVNDTSVYTINSNINLQIQGGTSCYQEVEVDEHKETQTNILATEDIADVTPIIDLIKKCGEMFGSVRNKLTERLKKVKSKGQWETFLHTARSSITLCRRDGSSIRVQPTSLSRRKPGVTRGSKRLPLGRPAVGEKVIKKTCRNLAENIRINQPNAKSHGKNF